MPDNKNLLNNVLLFLAPLHPMPAPLSIRADYIIETQVGCFRIAYSPKTRTAALFYARHPDDLAGIKDTSGRQDIAHKERIYLIRMARIYHDPDATWDENDKRLQLDLSWIEPAIQNVIRVLPRIDMREAVLHRRANPLSYDSAFVAYEDEALPNDGKLTNIVTKVDNNFALPERSSSNRGGLLRRLFRFAARVTLQNYPSMPLRYRSEGDDDQHLVTSSLRRRSITEIILADFSNRLEQIWAGLDPIRWREKPLLPLFRASAAFRNQVDHWKHFKASQLEPALRKGITTALLVAMHGGISLLALKPLLVHRLADVGEKEKMYGVPSEWRKIISKHARRLVSIDSALHRTLMRPDPAEFHDLEWLDPQKHSLSITAIRYCAPEANPERTFRLWLGSLFLSPYATTFEYIGAHGSAIDLEDLRQTRAIRLHVSNGIVMHYVPKTKILYSYYHRPNYYVRMRKLPTDAAEFFKPDDVLVIDFNERKAPLQHIPFASFQDNMRQLLEAPTYAPSSAETPDADAMNNGGRAVMTPTIPWHNSGDRIAVASHASLLSAFGPTNIGSLFRAQQRRAVRLEPHF